MDQLVNNAAKWHDMFGGQDRVPLTIRLIVGRGWGQGPTHSQSLHAWFAHVPGLKVVMPASPADAKGLLLSSIFDDGPVLFIEHRWLHGIRAEVPDGDYRVALGAARHVRSGSDVTIVAYSYMAVEALHAAEALEGVGISCELVDMRSIKPADWGMILESVRKTGRLLALDTGWATGSVAGEVVARVSMECFGSLKCAPRRMGLPDAATPTSPALSEHYYSRAGDICRVVLEMLGRDLSIEIPASGQTGCFHDVPGAWFKGSF
jgi:pyruvate dehydrogenase E1 component beta subunit